MFKHELDKTGDERKEVRKGFEGMMVQRGQLERSDLQIRRERNSGLTGTR